MRPEDLPSLFAIVEGVFQVLQIVRSGSINWCMRKTYLGERGQFINLLPRLQISSLRSASLGSDFIS